MPISSTNNAKYLRAKNSQVEQKLAEEHQVRLTEINKKFKFEKERIKKDKEGDVSVKHSVKKPGKKTYRWEE